MIVAYIDGGARGNPGPAGYGVRIETADGTLLDELHGGLGIATNNVAEYNGLLAALQWAVAHRQPQGKHPCCSELLVKQMRGGSKVRNAGLQPLYAQARLLTGKLDQVKFEHVRRELNKEADGCRTLEWSAAEALLALATLAFSPLEAFWFQRVSGLAADLAAFSTWPLRILVLLPALEFVLSIQRARWIVARRTGVVTMATAVEAAGLAASLLFMIGALNLAGAVGGALAMLLGRVGANVYLYVRQRAAVADELAGQDGAILERLASGFASGRRGYRGAARIAPTIRPAAAPSARYECSSPAWVLVHNPDTWMLPAGTPASRSWSAFARARSRYGLGVGPVVNHRSTCSWPASSNARTTSCPTSPQHAPRQGPMAATRSAGADPNSRVMDSTATAAARSTVPRHPACAAATTPSLRSAIRMGAQSATRTPIADCGSSETMTSASGRVHDSIAPRRITATPARWTWRMSRTWATCMTSATVAHSEASSVRRRSRVLNRCAAISSSGRHRSTRPAAVWLHSNAASG